MSSSRGAIFRAKKLHAGTILVLLSWFLLNLATPAEAYIGPGAGFALVSSFFVVLTTILATPLLMLYSPLYALWLARLK